MVMSMDASSEQAMMSSSIDEHAAIGDAAIDPSSSSTYSQLQQQDDDEQNEDEHSKDSSQTVVLARQQLEEAKESSVRLSESSEQAPMVVSRGSSLDEDRRPAMNVDEDESLDEESPSPPSSKFALIEKKEIPTGSRFVAPPPLPAVDSLVAQMRDIVEGGSSSNQRQQVLQESQPRQPKSSSDSLNNRDEQNNSKASLESATKSNNKRTRHSRCRHHHHHHHHQHRHRQSISGSAVPPSAGQEAATVAERQSNSSGQHEHHHHHHHHHARNSSSAHRHHHHHHAHHHAHHHHHQEQHSQEGSARDLPAKRHSIQRPSLALIDPTGGSSSLIGKRRSKAHGSQSSVSSISSTALQQQQQKQQQQQEATTGSQCQQQSGHNNPNQQGSNPESKSSETPSDEKNFEQSGQQQQASGSGRASFQHGYAHHHHHHHHCHHRAAHEKRLVLDVSTNHEPEGQQLAADGGANADQEAVKKRGPLQEIACANEQQSRSTARHHTHQGHSHPLHHHHHHHHHHHPTHHAQCSHRQQLAAEGQQQQQSSTTSTIKDGQDLVQAASARGHLHHHRHHRHHRHAHHHAHHCKQHRQRNAKQISESKTNISEMSNQELSGFEQTNQKQQQQLLLQADIETNDENKMSSVESRRMSSMSNRKQEVGADTKSMVVDQELVAKEAAGSVGNANDEIVEMEMSPSNEARQQPPDDKQLIEQSATSDTNLITSIEIIPASNQATGGSTQLSSGQQQQTGKTSSNVVAITHGQPPSDSNQFQETSYKIDAQIEHKENRHDGARQNRLVRQMSSQSSKKSQKSDMGAGGAGGSGTGGNDHKNQRHTPDCSSQAPLQSVINQQPSEPKQVIESSVPTDRRCRLCWCCCCPCSALTNREGVARGATGPDDSKVLTDPASAPTTRFPSLPNVPLDEIRAWGESFDKLMRCKDGRKVFQDFLRCEYSEENILFWSACEELKKERDSKNIAAKARDIYEDYISILSSKEVSLDSRVRDVINNNIKKPTSNIFDEAQLQIYTLMHRDSYPRFINSAMYKKLAKIQNNSSRKSSS